MFGITKQFVWLFLPLTGLAIGTFLDNKETERMTRFRDKSALYGRAMRPSDQPSW